MRKSRLSGLLTGALLAGGLVLGTEVAAGDGYGRPSAQRDSWTGFYVGLNAGIGGSGVGFAFPTFDVEADHRGYGFVGGAQVGYNLHISGLVVGVEGDIAWSNIDGQSLCPNADFRCSHEVDMLASLRARLGVLVTPGTLLYLTGGVGWANADYAVRNVATGVLAAPGFSDTQSGGAFGGGIEVRISDNLSLKGEYLHFDLGGESVPNGTLVQNTGPVDLDLRIDTVKVGLNWKF